MAQHVEVRASGNGQEGLGTPNGLKTILYDSDGTEVAFGGATIKYLAATGDVIEAPCVLESLLCCVSGTVTVHDAASATTPTYGPITMTAGQSWYPNAVMGVGLHIVLTTATVIVTYRA